ncbi:MAG: DUF423 domain-containing protein [Pseudomonadota bacterium]
MDTLAALGAFAGLIAVSLGAFGAHGLEGRLSEEQQEWWETATLYLLAHAPTVLYCTAKETRRTAGWAIVIGAFVFSGTLYAMSLGAPRLLGAVTPIGGLGLVIGWSLLAITYVRK